MTRYFSTLALALAAALLTPQVKAEKVVVYREGQLVNPQDVAAVLGKTRSDPPARRCARSPDEVRRGGGGRTGEDLGAFLGLCAHCSRRLERRRLGAVPAGTLRLRLR